MPRVVKPKGNAMGSEGAPPVKKAAGVGKKNASYDKPEKIPEGALLTDLARGKWKIGTAIGTGGFGDIYTACRLGEKSYDYVVKCEPHGNGPLFVEMHFYMRSARLEDVERYQQKHGLRSFGMPYMVANGSTEINGLKHRFIVIPRYGTDVAHYYEANGRRLPEGTVYRLALQMLDVYVFIHECGYVHADLKAANMLVGAHGAKREETTQAYLVDYGLASHYTTKEFKPDPRQMHNGTLAYTSRDAHQGVATMRADLEILGYNLIEWLGVQLPWMTDKILAAPIKVQKSKEEFMADVSANLKKMFLKGVPVPLAEFMVYVAKMEYNETPDYDKCRNIFANALKAMKIPSSGELELEMINSSEPSTSSKAAAKVARGANRPPPVVASSTDSSIDEVEDDDDTTFEPSKTIEVPTTSRKITAKNRNTKAKPTKKRSPVVPHKEPTATRSAARPGIISPSPATSVQSPSTSPDRAIINASVTANPSAVAVKRKKKPPTAANATENGSAESDAPVTRMQLRTRVRADDAGSSTRAVTAKKPKRVERLTSDK